MGITNFPNGISSFGQVIYGSAAPTTGKVYHVKKTADTNYGRWAEQNQHTYWDGSSSIQTSIEGALSVAEDFDTIWVHPGQWIPASTLAFTQENLKLLAVQAGPWGALSRTEIRQTGAKDMITANGAHNLEIAGFRLTFYGSTSYAAVRLASSAVQYNTWIHDNNFYALSPESGLSIVCGIEASYATDTTYITNNVFWKGNPKIITLGQGMRTHIIGNQFTQIGGAGKYAIYAEDLTAGVRNSFILNNRFFMVEDANGVGVHLGPNYPTGDIMIDNNSFVGYAGTDYCISDYDPDSSGMNYHNGALIAS